MSQNTIHPDDFAARGGDDEAQPKKPVPFQTARSTASSWKWVKWGTAGIVVVLLLFGGNAAFKWHVSAKTEAFRSQCKAALKARKWDELLAIARQWRSWSPKDDDSLMFLSQAATELNELDVAANALGQVANDYKGALQALAIRGEMLFMGLNRPLEAEETWLRMLSISPKADTPRQRLTYFYAMTFQRKKLRSQIEESIRLGCESPESYLYLITSDSLRFSDGLALTTRWLMSTPENEVLEAAQAVFASKKTEGEQILSFASEMTTPSNDALLDRCFNKYPSNMELLVLKMDRASYEGNTGEVLKYLEKAPAEANEDARFWRTKGWLYLTFHKHTEAISALERAMQLNPFEWQSRWLYADVLRQLGRTKEAEAVSEVAMQGKQLHRRIFERSNVRDIDEDLLREIHSYLKATSPAWILEAFERRI